MQVPIDLFVRSASSKDLRDNWTSYVGKLDYGHASSHQNRETNRNLKIRLFSKGQALIILVSKLFLGIESNRVSDRTDDFVRECRCSGVRCNFPINEPFRESRH